jgi:hypothetical protein
MVSLPRLPMPAPPALSRHALAALFTVAATTLSAQTTESVSFVMKGGRVYRNDGARVAGVRQTGARQ